MSESRDSGCSGIRRRALLASAAAGATGLAGCLSRFRTVRSQDLPDQISLDILTLPGDDDAVATQIGRRLAGNLEEVGVDVDLVLYPEDEFRREVLINQDYDLFVTAHPNIQGPDSLRTLLHSSFVREIGWQNPFGLTDFNLDELLEEQQFQSGSERRQAIVELQHETIRQQPLIPVAVPDTIRASRPERFSGWRAMSGDLAQSFARLERLDTDTNTLHVVSTDGRITRNLNPIAIEYRNRGQVTGALYDSLGRYYGGRVRPWAASDWELSRVAGGTVATVTLQPDLEFHDGTPLTAQDVVFTVEFLQDTSLGELEVQAPAPRFRGRSSLIDKITALDDETLEITFPETGPETALRGLTVPIFPKREWEEKTGPADIAGVELSEAVTEALVWANDEPLGSGPLQFESAVEDQELVLRRNDDHLLNREPDALPTQLAERFAGGIPFERLEIQIVRSDDAALGLLINDDVDATISDMNPAIVPRIGREAEIDLHVEQSPLLYLVGCNTLRAPLGNPHFRRLIARLVDKGSIQVEVFGGFARPASSPLAGTEWLPTDLRWEDGDPELPFFGRDDGEIDIEGVRNYLRDAGFEFSRDGELLEQ